MFNDADKEIEKFRADLENLKTKWRDTLLVDDFDFRQRMQNSGALPSASKLDSVAMCPNPNPDFAGRAEILSRLHDFFGSDMSSRRVFALYGLGGSGKSQIVYKCVEQWQSFEKQKRCVYT